MRGCVLCVVLALSACELGLQEGRYECDPAAADACPHGFRCAVFYGEYRCVSGDSTCGDR